MGRYSGVKRGRKGYGAKDPFEKVVCYIPKNLMVELKYREGIYGVPVDRLITRGLLNAMSAGVGFDYNTNIDVSVNGVTNEDEKRLFKWLCKSDKGFELDLLLMAHEEIGFTDINLLRATIRLLVVKGLAHSDHTNEYVPVLRHNIRQLKRRGKRDKIKSFAGEDKNGKT